MVDPDDHHLVASLGCAAENLAQAARAYGFEPTVEQEPDARAEYDGRPAAGQDLRRLEEAARADGVDVLLLTGRDDVDGMAELVVEGNTAQLADPAFVEELKSWTRFGHGEAVERGDGLFSRTVGNPAVPRWLGSRVFGLVLTPERENPKYARQVRSSAGVAVFSSSPDLRTQWVEVGRAFQRFALRATALGLRTALVNQPVEVPRLRR